jgi:hypothetical protein
MKKQGAIRHKLKQVRHRLLQKALRTSTSKKPCNCKHSGLVRGSASEPLFHVCLLDADKPREWEGTICDPSVPNTCPFFKPSQTREEIEEAFNQEFDRLIKDGDMGKLASKYPDVAALLWVLSESSEEDEPDEAPPSGDHED